MKKIKAEISKEVAAMIDNDERGPHLAAVLVGDDPASQTYVASKEKACASVGMISSLYKYPATVTEKEILGNLRKVSSNRTTINITHRLSSLPFADKILIIEEGRNSKEI